MKTLKFLVTVEGLPDHTKDYRAMGDICAGSTQRLRAAYPDGQVVVSVAPEKTNERPSSPLWFDGDDGAGGRYQRNSYGLHCGDCFEVMIGDCWRLVRIEHSSFSKHSHGWYLVEFPSQPLEGLPARKAA